VVLQRLVTGATIPPVNELKEIESMLAERVGKWTKTWKEQGIEEGREEGRKEGEIIVLERQLTRRFGPLPEAFQMRLQAATTEQLEHWADQILDATRLEDVFRDQDASVCRREGSPPTRDGHAEGKVAERARLPQGTAMR